MRRVKSIHSWTDRPLLAGFCSTHEEVHLGHCGSGISSSSAHELFNFRSATRGDEDACRGGTEFSVPLPSQSLPDDSPLPAASSVASKSSNKKPKPKKHEVRLKSTCDISLHSIIWLRKGALHRLREKEQPTRAYKSSEGSTAQTRRRLS